MKEKYERLLLLLKHTLVVAIVTWFVCVCVHVRVEHAFKIRFNVIVILP